MPNHPNLSITSDMRMLAVIVNPANGPAPTLLTNNKSAMTANAPTRPPRGAHHGIVLTPASVSIGRGRHKTRHARNATIGRKEDEAGEPRICQRVAQRAIHWPPPSLQRSSHEDDGIEPGGAQVLHNPSSGLFMGPAMLPRSPAAERAA